MTPSHETTTRFSGLIFQPPLAKSTRRIAGKLRESAVDRKVTHEHSQALDLAHKVLSNAEKRAAYDRISAGEVKPRKAVWHEPSARVGSSATARTRHRSAIRRHSERRHATWPG